MGTPYLIHKKYSKLWIKVAKLLAELKPHLIEKQKEKNLLNGLVPRSEEWNFVFRQLDDEIREQLNSFCRENYPEFLQIKFYRTAAEAPEDESNYDVWLHGHITIT